MHDEASFQAAVAAREQRAEELSREEIGDVSGGGGAKRWAQEDGKEYPISTERADAVARWVREAPVSVAGPGKAKRGAKKGKARREGGDAMPTVEGLELNAGNVQQEAGCVADELSH